MARIVFLAVQKYRADNCKDKASAQTYYTILSIVPLAAMAFGLAKSFGFANELTNMVNDMLVGHEVIAEYVLNFADTYLTNMKGGLVAGIGFALLLWAVMNLIGHTEKSFNQIFETSHSRSLVRKFSDYISIVLIALIAIAAYSSVMVMMTGFVSDGGIMGEVWRFLASISPFIAVWISLSLIYYILPSTKVKFSSALLGGAIAGIALIATQFAYLYFQIGMSKNNAIYGSFAAIPLFLIWMQTTWHIVLLGCEVAFACQNAESYNYEINTRAFSLSLRRKIALSILSYVVKEFDACHKAPTLKDISTALKLPVPYVVRMLDELSNAGLISMLRNDDDTESSFQPAFDIGKLTIAVFVDKMENNGNFSYPMQSDEFKKVEKIIDTYVKGALSADGEKLVKDI
jgi:membrane protein